MFHSQPSLIDDKFGLAQFQLTIPNHYQSFNHFIRRFSISVPAQPFHSCLTKMNCFHFTGMFDYTCIPIYPLDLIFYLSYLVLPVSSLSSYLYALVICFMFPFWKDIHCYFSNLGILFPLLNFPTISCFLHEIIKWLFFLKFMYLFWEREWSGEGQRERERENSKQALHCQCRALCGAWTHELWDHDSAEIE